MSFKEYGKAFKEIRLQKGVSLNHLESISGVSKATVSQFENGHSLLSFERLEKILQALDVTLRDFSLVTHKGQIEGFITQFQLIERYFLNQEMKELREIHEANSGSSEKSDLLISLSAKACYTQLTPEEIKFVESYFSLGVDWGLFDLYALSNLLDQMDMELVIDLLDELLSNQEVCTYFGYLHDYRDPLVWILTKSCLLLMEKKERFFVQILLRKMQRFTAENYLMAKLSLCYLEGCYDYVFVSTHSGNKKVMRMFDVLEEIGAKKLKSFVSNRFERIKEVVQISERTLSNKIEK